MGYLGDDTVITITTHPTISDPTITGDSVVPSSQPTVEEGLEGASLISSSPATMVEDPKHGSVIPPIPPTREELKDDSVIHSIPPTKEDQKDGSVIPSIPPIEKHVIAMNPDNPTDDDSVTANTTNPTMQSNDSAKTNTITIFYDTEKNISFLRKLKQVDVLKHGVIVEVLYAIQATVAEVNGVKGVLITGQKDPRISMRHMVDPLIIKDAKKTLKNTPVMAKVRVGHLGEAKILEALGLVQFIEESALLPPADSKNYINKHNFDVPFVCGCGDLGEALNRVNEGTVLIRIQGNNIYDTVTKVKKLMKDLRNIKALDDDEVFAFARKLSVPYDLVVNIRKLGKFPALLFAAGGITRPADAALMRCLGCDGVLIGSEVFKIPNAGSRLYEILLAMKNFRNPKLLHNLGLT